MKCRVAVFLIIGWGVLSLIGYLKKDGIYKNYSIDVKKTPYFVLVLDGIHDKIYPWSKELPDLLPDGTKPQNPESVIASTEMTDEENVAEQTETVCRIQKRRLQNQRNLYRWMTVILMMQFLLEIRER